MWRALAQGDLQTLGGFYAEDVQILGGSEFLKPRWGGEEGERERGVTISRGDWLARYGAALKELGKQKWAAAMTRNREPIPVSIEATHNGQSVADMGLGAELVLRASPGDEELLFFLGRDESGRWWVVGERSDY